MLSAEILSRQETQPPTPDADHPRPRLYVSPVGFSSAIVPEKWQLLYALNPMVRVIEGFRWAIIGQGAFINPVGFWLSMAIVALLAITGVRQFRRMEKRFADVI